MWKVDAACGWFSGIRQVAPVCTPSNTCFLGSTRVQIPNCIWICSAVFAQLTAERPCTLQWAAPSPSKLSGSPSNTWFLGPTGVHNPNGFSIRSAIFAGLTSVTDRPTDRATRSITVVHIYVCSTVMQPKNCFWYLVNWPTSVGGVLA